MMILIVFSFLFIPFKCDEFLEDCEYEEPILSLRLYTLFDNELLIRDLPNDELETKGL
jgi:hypothetical protein